MADTTTTTNSTTTTTVAPTDKSQVIAELKELIDSWSTTNKKFDETLKDSNFFREIFHSIKSLNEVVPLLYESMFGMSTANQFWVYKKNVGPNSLNFYWSDLYPAPTETVVPSVGDTVIDLIGNVYSLTAVSPDNNSGHGGGIASYGGLQFNIAGNPDLSAYLKSTDASNTYLTKESYNADSVNFQKKLANSSIWFNFSSTVGPSESGFSWSNLSPVPTSDKYPLVGDVVFDSAGNLYYITAVDSTKNTVDWGSSFADLPYVAHSDFNNSLNNLDNKYLSKISYYNGNIDNLRTNGLYSVGSSASGPVVNAGGVLLVGNSTDYSVTAQIYIDNSGDIYCRTSKASGSEWNSFNTVFNDTSLRSFLAQYGYCKVSVDSNESSASSDSSVNTTILYLVPEAS